MISRLIDLHVAVLGVAFLEIVSVLRAVSGPSDLLFDPVGDMVGLDVQKRAGTAEFLQTSDCVTVAVLAETEI